MLYSSASTRSLFLLIALLFATPLLAQAQSGKRGYYGERRYSRYQPSNTEGFFLQGHLTAAGLEIEDFETDGGGGFGLKVGYGLNPIVTLYAGIDVAVIEDLDLPGFDLGRRFDDDFRFGDDEFGYFSLDLGTQLHFGSGRNKLVPYLDLALSYSGIAYEVDNGFFSDEDVTISGGGASVGAGLKYFISPSVALDLSLTGTVAEYEDVTIDGEELHIPLELDASAARLGFGISWYPSR